MEEELITRERKRRYLHVGIAIFQCFLGAGVVFGWTSILPLLEKEGIYNEYCQNEAKFCEAQSIQLHFAFTIAASSSMCANLFLGLLFDKYGPRTSKAISIIFLMIGSASMGKSHNRRKSPDFDYFLPGMALLAFGGTGLQLCSIHLSNLFPEAKSLVTCLIVGALQLSFFIFGIFNYGYQHFGLSQQAIFEMYTIVLLGCLIITLLLNPDKPFQLPCPTVDAKHEQELLSPIRLPSVFKKGDASLMSATPTWPKGKGSKGKADAAERENLLGKKVVKDRSFRTQVASSPFFLLLVLFSVGTLWSNYFLGSVLAQLRWKKLPPMEIDNLMSYFGLILPGGVIFIPFIGYLFEIWGYIKPTILCCISSLLFTALFWSNNFRVIVASFIIYTFFRTMLFALVFAYLGHTFGFKNFGALSGIVFCVAAAVGLLQTPITQLGDFGLVGKIQFATLLLTFGLPVYEIYA